MMREFSSILALVTVVVSVASCKGEGTVGPSDPGTAIFAVTQDNRLIQFGSKTPSVLRNSVSITGLVDASTFVTGMDFRSADGALFIVTAEDRMYTVDTATGVATQVGSGSTIGFPVAGLNFNSATDTIRAIGSLNQNKRISASGASVGTDAALAYATGDSGDGVTPVIRGLSYSNDGSVITAFVIDAGRDVLATLGNAGGSPNSPNSGLLFTIGALGTDHPAAARSAFDIDAKNGISYAAFPAGGTGASHLWEIKLTTGVATDLGEIRTSANGTDFQIVGLSLPP